MKGRVINLNEHPIEIQDTDGIIYHIPPSGYVTTVKTKAIPCGALTLFLDVPVVTTDHGGIETLCPDGSIIDGLPDIDGALPLVSEMVLSICTVTAIAPDTGPTAIRDKRGKLLAITRFMTKVGA